MLIRTAMLLLCSSLVSTAFAETNKVAMEGATAEVYKHASGDDLWIYRFEPQAHDPQTDQRPAVVFYFGGGWNGGTVRQFEQHARYLASRGMVAFVADYRVKSRQGTAPNASVADGKSAIRWVRKHAKRLGIDPDRIAAGGGSAGGVPDAVMIVGFPESGVQLFRDYYSTYASDTPDLDIIVPDGLMDADLPGEVDSDMNNVIGTQPSADGPGAEFFTTEYQAAYDEEPGVFTAQAYDAMAINVLAATAAGENTGSAIRDRIRTVANPGGEEFGPETLVDAVETVAAGDPVHYVGASSSANFDVNGDIVTAAYDIRDFQDGELETVDTVEFGTGLSEDDDELAVRYLERNVCQRLHVPV